MLGLCLVIVLSWRIFGKLWLLAGLRMETLELGGSGRKPIVCWSYHSSVSLCAPNSYCCLSNLTISSVATIGFFYCCSIEDLKVIFSINFRNLYFSLKLCDFQYNLLDKLKSFACKVFAKIFVVHLLKTGANAKYP